MKSITPSVTLGFALSYLSGVSTALRVPRDTEKFDIEPVDSAKRPFRAIYFDAVRTLRTADLMGGSVLNITDQMDISYMTDVNVGGQNFSLQLDTGSSDLWLHSPTPVNTTNTTDTLITLTYGLGSAAGKVDYASLAIGDYTIPEQAFVNANRVEHQDLSGIFPLGLDSLSVIYSTLSELSDEDAVFTPAQPPLSSLFTQGTQEANTNFIGLALERSEDQENVSGGILSIGEYDPRFPLIANATPIALASASRWTIPLEGLAINGKPAPLASSVRHAKPGTSIALIDSGTTLAYIPEATVNAIYGAMPGSKHLTHDGNNVWLVPCLASANVTLEFGGDTFAVDPLDLTIVTTSIQANGSTYTVCVNAFQAQAAGIPGEVDMILGDTFMRNVYSVFNFGNSTLSGDFSGKPSIQMLARTDADAAAAAFIPARNATLADMPPLIDPRDVPDT